MVARASGKIEGSQVPVRCPYRSLRRADCPRTCRRAALWKPTRLAGSTGWDERHDSLSHMTIDTGCGTQSSRRRLPSEPLAASLDPKTGTAKAGHLIKTFAPCLTYLVKVAS